MFLCSVQFVKTLMKFFLLKNLISFYATLSNKRADRKMLMKLTIGLLYFHTFELCYENHGYSEFTVNFKGFRSQMMNLLHKSSRL